MFILFLGAIYFMFLFFLFLFVIIVVLSRMNLSISLDGVYYVYPVQMTNKTWNFNVNIMI